MKNYDLLKVVATKLNGLQYPLREIYLKDLLEYCKKNGIVICYGQSDDLMELTGAVYDEYGCYNGGTICIDEKGNHADANLYFPITAIWAKDDISWQYEFEPKHEVFEIYEDADIYCKGIVFFVDDLKRNKENEQLIELPCKIGDTVYWCNGITISPYRVNGFADYGDGYGLRLLIGEMQASLQLLGKDLFISKEDAEARLKELRGEK